MKKLDTSKKIILLISFLCLVGAAVLIFIMPKPERKLPPLPEANYTYDMYGSEFHKDGLRKIMKGPRISFDYVNSSIANTAINALETSDFNSYDFPLEEGQSATFMINKSEVTLTALEFISYKSEGIYTVA
jgi:hypothetical protein